VSNENNGRFPDGSAVLARFPLGDNDEDRDCWPWLEATVEQQCGPDEWLVTIEDWRVAQLEDGSPAEKDSPDGDLFFRQAYRGHSELRAAAGEEQP
jgi:hypothetical protein